MPACAAASNFPAIARLDTQWARCEDDVRDAQRLRFQVFAQEMGARLVPPDGTPPGLDADRFDPYCDHLLVRAIDAAGGEAPGALVGTYRVLTPGAARRAGGFYSDTEFDLTPLDALRAHAVELGRSCVHPAWRSGGVIMALWSALGRYMAGHGLDTMIGCASVGMADHGQAASRLWQRLRHTHLVDREWRVQPRIALPLGAGNGDGGDGGHDGHDGNDEGPGAMADMSLADAPPLIKGYLRCGARVLGPPALDRDFNTADLPLMLRVGDLAPRYRQHFFGAPV